MGNISRIEVKKHEANSQNFVSNTRKPCCSKTRSSPVDRVLFLQRTIGNQAVERLVKSGALQAKLKIGATGDVYEQEADRMADAVMRMTEPQAVSHGTAYIQRACPKCEEKELKRQPIKEEEDEEEKLQRKTVEEEEEEVQAKATSGSIFEVNHDLESHIQSLKGGGKSLSENERAFFEPRFGFDFSQVRIHTDTQAAESAREMNARAFTVGRDVVFGAGESLGTMEGQRLLAHELTHVVQQNAGHSSTQREMIQCTRIGTILDMFFSPFSTEHTWIMDQSDPYTGIVRQWQPVINAVGAAKRDLERNCDNWRLNHMTDPSWRPGPTDPPVTDPNAFAQWVASPPGTDPETARNAFIIYVLTGAQTDELHTSAIGSFGIYITANDVDCTNKRCRLQVWMYNAMDQASFGRFASYFPLSGMARQYMWWNWVEEHNWGPPPPASGGGGSPGGGGGWEAPPPTVYACFVADTEVTLPNGTTTIRIADLRLGQAVLAFDEQSKETRVCKVVQCQTHKPDQYLEIRFAEGRILRVTANHPIYSDGCWVAAGNLRPGERVCVLTSDGRGIDNLQVEAVEKNSRVEPLYDLTIADCHTFFADGILVHNKP